MSKSSSGVASQAYPGAIAFYAMALLSLSASVAFILSNRLRGLGYFDGSEYALHIQGGGIAHAPGYPLYLGLCRLVHACGADAFLSQQVISVLAMGVAALALYKTFAIEVGTSRPGFAGALAVSIATLCTSYYLRLFAIIPEVFLLNVGLLSLLILAITRFYYSSNETSIAVVFFMYGLGLSHHHTMAFTLPGFTYLLVKKLRSFKLAKTALFASIGLALGSLPLVYLFWDSGSAASTYYRVHDLESLWFVLLRKGYGTFQLSPLHTKTDIHRLFYLVLEGMLKNFNYLGLFVFAPLFLWSRASRKTSEVACAEGLPAAGERGDSYRWTNPSLLIAWSTCLVFLVFFIPNCNLELGARTYRTIFLRFLTIPCFLLTYLVFRASLRLWDWVPSHQVATVYGMLACVICSTLTTYKGLLYGACDLLDEHVRQGYAAIFSYIRPAPSRTDPSRHQCVVFAQGDTLLMSIKYYNEFVAKKKCFIFSSTSLTGQFLDRHELHLASETLGISLSRLQAGEYATHPESLLNMFLALDKQGYALFVFGVTDYTEYFGKLFVNSPFAYRPVGNVLQVITSDSAPFGMDRMYISYESYVHNLEIYVNELQTRNLPSEVVDSQANQALILNLADYSRFSHYYPVTPEVAAGIERRASAVQANWLALVPRE